jgi:hypothetical protein
MQDALGYEFFTYEGETPLELDPAYGEKYAQDYNRKVGKLAWDISQLLKKLETDTGNSGHDEQATAKATIYLAECSYDRKETREILEGDLRHHGYTVLPDQQLPRDEADYVAAVERLLERCRLAIHLVGESYGAVPVGPSQKSVAELQNELAVQRSKSGALARVIWLPENPLRAGTAAGVYRGVAPESRGPIRGGPDHWGPRGSENLDPRHLLSCRISDPRPDDWPH